MQPVITHSITDLKSCEAVLKIMLAKNPNVGMIVVSGRAKRTILNEVNEIAQKFNMSARNGLSVMGVKIRTREEQDAFEAAQKEAIERHKAHAEIMEQYQQQAVRMKLEEEKMRLTEDQFDASKPLEKWVKYKRGLGRLKGPKWRSFSE